MTDAESIKLGIGPECSKKEETRMRTLQITCIMEMELEDDYSLAFLEDTNAWVYEFYKAIAKVAKEHGLSHRLYHDLWHGKPQ